MAKISENSVKVINYLKENADKNLTANDVAAALELTVAQVNGTFTALQNKELGTRVEAEVPGAVDITFISVTDAGKAADASELSENGQAILAYMIENEGTQMTSADAADAMGIDRRKFTGAFNSLVKKELCARTAAKVEAPVKVKYLKLTQAGVEFDPTADAE